MYYGTVKCVKQRDLTPGKIEETNGCCSVLLLINVLEKKPLNVVLFLTLCYRCVKDS